MMMDSPTTATTTSDYQKRKNAMAKRLATLGKDNPVVAKAIKNQKPPEEDTKWKNWNIVDELVSAARREYFDKEGGEMKGCIANLAKALMKLASKSPIDNEKKTVQNSDNEDEY